MVKKMYNIGRFHYFIHRANGSIPKSINSNHKSILLLKNWQLTYLRQERRPLVWQFNAGNQQSFIVIVFAQDFVVAQIEFVADTESSSIDSICFVFNSLSEYVYNYNTCDCSFDRRNIPSGKHCLWLSSPFRMPE